MKNKINELYTKHLQEAMEDSDFEMGFDDVKFTSYYNQLLDLSERNDVAILHQVEANMWFVFHDFIDEVLELLGFEYVGHIGRKEDDDLYQWQKEVVDKFDLMSKVEDDWYDIFSYRKDAQGKEIFRFEV